VVPVVPVEDEELPVVVNWTGLKEAAEDGEGADGAAEVEPAPLLEKWEAKNEKLAVEAEGDWVLGEAEVEGTDAASVAEAAAEFFVTEWDGVETAVAQGP